MRVLHLDAGREMRGGQWQVLRLIAGLEREGFECILLARPESPLFLMACKAGSKVEALGVRNLMRWSRSCDLIHAHDARSHTLALLTPGTPLVVSRRVAFAPRAGWKYGRASRYIAVSEYVKSVLVAAGVRSQKVSVVYDGVPLLESAHGTAVLAPANAADTQKGAALAHEAARLAGVPIEFTAQLERDLPRAGLFVYITHSEGLGSAALLAMSAAVPVIASDIGGLREVIRHGENGLLVENSASRIAAAIQELTANPGLARRLGQAGRQTIEERFTIDIMVRRTRQVYDEVLR